MKAKAETEHNGDWKTAWYKANDWIAETEHNGDWNNVWYKTIEWNAETEHNGDWNNEIIKPLKEKQKRNIMVTEIMHAKKPMNAKKYIINVNINPTHKFCWMHT